MAPAEWTQSAAPLVYLQSSLSHSTGRVISCERLWRDFACILIVLWALYYSTDSSDRSTALRCRFGGCVRPHVSALSTVVQNFKNTPMSEVYGAEHLLRLFGVSCVYLFDSVTRLRVVASIDLCCTQ